MEKSIKELNQELREVLQLNEMSMAWVDTKAQRCVWVENPNTHETDYFKYYNSFSYHKADAVARISLLEPKYIKHRNLDGKNAWKLTNKEKRELIRLMNAPSKVHAGFTNWQATLIQYNFDNFFIQPEDTINRAFNKEEFPDAFDVDYPMPDYMQL